VKRDLGPVRIERGARARRDGGRAEWLAALLLMAKGYRILGMRLRTPQAEVDLAAVRGAVLAIVEVKRRRTLEEALLAVSPSQRERLRRAGLALAARLGRNKPAVVRLDLVALAPKRWPRHIADAWSEGRLG
jgi:putative endonuclease